MAGIRMFEEQLRIMTPHTFHALQNLVMAMADVTKNAGKTTFFGRDKGQKSYSKFLEMLKITLQSMVLDEVIRESTPTEEVLVALQLRLDKFALAFPNWSDAYGFATMFLGKQRDDALATIERLRSMP
jgi:hypothetical protein